MMIFSQYCDTLEYLADTPSAAAIALDPDHGPGHEFAFDHCLLLQVSVETGDLPATVAHAAKAVRRIGRHTGAKQLLISGFAGFAAPDRRPDPAAARAVLTALHERLATPEWLVYDAPFGWEKRWRLEVQPGVWAQRVTWL